MLSLGRWRGKAATRYLSLDPSGVREALFETDFHQKLDADAVVSGDERLDASNLGEVVTIDGGGILGIGHGDEEAHPDLIGVEMGMEIDAGTRDAERPADIFEMVVLGIRRTDTQDLSNLAATACSALRF